MTGTPTVHAAETGFSKRKTPAERSGKRYQKEFPPEIFGPFGMQEAVLTNNYSPRGNVLSRNYELLPGFMQFGEGDLLIDEGDCLSAIEFKHIDLNATGKTARARRTHHRNRVKQQSEIHAAYTKIRHPDRRVQAVVVTNEGEFVVCRDMDLSTAIARVVSFFGTIDYGMIPTKASDAIADLFSKVLRTTDP